jgi:AcrR family transcriptional regulator
MTERVPKEIVEAAVAAARERGRDVAEVPLTAIAAAAGISRSTLVRRIGGSRSALEAAVRETGVDPGGRPPVRERAIEAGARLIGEHGLGAVTLDAVAVAAQCSLPSLHTVFEGRDGLLAEIYERYSPIPDLEGLMADPPANLEEAVRGVYRALVASFEQEPRVTPALMADLFARPEGPAGRIFHRYFPRLLGTVGAWLVSEVRAGRIRALPLPLLVQQMVGPLAMHMLLRPALERELGADLPTVEEACTVFADAFLRSAAVGGASGSPAKDRDDPESGA